MVLGLPKTGFRIDIIRFEFTKTDFEIDKLKLDLTSAEDRFGVEKKGFQDWEKLVLRWKKGVRVDKRPK